jgi:RNA polymerase sigma factor (sigma-70 family)
MTQFTRDILTRLSKQHPALSPDQEADLIFRNWSDPDRLRKLLVFHNVHLIFWLMKKMRVSENRKDDFVSDCFLGLQKAALGFRASSGKRFGNYAISAMRNEVFATWKNERTAEDRYRFVYMDAKPSVESPEDSITGWVRLNADTEVDGDISDELDSFDDREVTREVMSFVWKSPELSDNAKEVFRLLYRNSMNSAEVARLSGRSRQRVDQIKARVLKVVRGAFGQAKPG